MKKIVFKILKLAVVFIGYVHLVCNYTAGFFPWALFFIAVSIVTILVAFILALKQKKEWSISITLLIGLAFSYFLSEHQDNQRDTKSRTLVQALDKYKADNGYFPLTEKELISKYLLKIPKSTWGFQNSDFHYTVSSDKSSFSIDYKSREGYDFYYTSTIEEWQFGD